MLAELFITETALDGDSFSSSFALVGPASEVAKEIAALGGDLHGRCLTGEILCYTLLTAFIKDNGKVVVS